MIFVESRSFTKRACELLGNEAYSKLQEMLIVNPDCGVVIQGCDGLRKIRAGLRVIYLHIPEADRCEMLLVYGKSEQEDLPCREKAVLRELAERANLEAAAWARKRPQGR